MEPLAFALGVFLLALVSWEIAWRANGPDWSDIRHGGTASFRDEAAAGGQ